MRSTFGGLEIAKTGLTISQLGLDLTGHNIANVDTKGYTRQRIITTAYDPNANIGKFRPVSQALIGGGVRVKILDQVRSSFLDRQFRLQNTNNSYWQTRTSNLTYLEAYFDDVQEETSLNYSVASFFDAIKSVSEDTVEGAQRKLLQSSGEYLTQHLNSIYDSLIDIQKTQDLAVETTVEEINTIAEQIADLNKSIHSYEVTGQIANDLRDKRNLLLDELSSLVNIEYQEAESSVTVWIGGEEFINHTTINKLGVKYENNVIDGEESVAIPYWKNTGEAFDKECGGELQAYMDMRDSEDVKTPGIPYFIEKLNDLARALVQEVNAIHRAGYTYPNGTTDSTNGVDFFGAKDENGNYYTTGDIIANIDLITAKNICLSEQVTISEYNIACSSEKIILGENNGTGTDLQAGNNNNMNTLYELFNKKTIKVGGTDVGSLDGFTTSIRFEVAATLEYSKSIAENRNIMQLSAENLRQSVSGVSLDEEMTNLVKYQHAYSGASRVISAMDEALDKLINGTGRVGL